MLTLLRPNQREHNSLSLSAQRSSEQHRAATMGSRLGRRVVHFANLPIKLLMPNTFSHITEIALKTVPSATKIEIKRVLESLYGFHVDKVRTLNMDGKKKKRGGLLIARPDYKKAYVTLLTPLSLSPDLFPMRVIADARAQAVASKRAEKSSVVEEGRPEPKGHWLEGRDDRKPKPKARPETASSFGRPGDGGAKFPWTAMRSSSPSSSGSR